MKLRPHQLEGAKRIVEQRMLWIGDEMGVGKTRQPIEAAQRLFEAGRLDTVIVLAPGPVAEAVWFNEDFGQIADGLRVPSRVSLYRPKIRQWTSGENVDAVEPLKWIISNYEFVRSSNRYNMLIPYSTRRTMLVLDESLAIKGRKSVTRKVVQMLRRRCGWVVLLNGTEGGGDTPADIFGQANMMSPSILNCRYWHEFMARYAVMDPHGYHAETKIRVNGKLIKYKKPVQVAQWVNLDDLWKRLDPFYLRRTKAECLDLPPKLPPVALSVPLSRNSWRIYCEMREDAVALLKDKAISSAEQAGVKAIRLAQITSGFLGGIEALNDDDIPLARLEEAAIIGSEKLTLLVEWVERLLEEESNAKFIVWCRFRNEAERAEKALRELLSVGLLIGGQTKAERTKALSLLEPRSAPDGPACVVGTIRTGCLGLNLHAADKAIYLSNDYSFVARSQSEDRCHRSGQHRPVSYFDVVATGPNGQKTVDHAVIKALREKRNVAEWRANEWLEALED